MPSGLLAAWAQSADVVIAADSGADRLLEAGVQPHRIVGDLDSASESALGLPVPIEHDSDQETTDCDKLLAAAARLGCDEITVVGLEGDLMDHTMGALLSVLRSPVPARIAWRRGVVHPVLPGRTIREATHTGARVSLLPAVECEGASLRGVRWPLEGAALSPLGLISISNCAQGESVEATLESGAAWLFVEVPTEEMPRW